MANKRTAEFWQEHLNNWRQSGQTLIAYCTTHKIGRSSMSRWQAKERHVNGNNNNGRITLIPVDAPAPLKTQATPTLHLLSPSGWRVELPLGTPADLAKLLQYLP